MKFKHFILNTHINSLEITYNVLSTQKYNKISKITNISLET